MFQMFQMLAKLRCHRAGKNLTVLLYEGGKRGKEGGQKEEGEGEKRGGKFEYCNMNFVGYLANYS